MDFDFGDLIYYPDTELNCVQREKVYKIGKNAVDVFYNQHKAEECFCSFEEAHNKLRELELIKVIGSIILSGVKLPSDDFLKEQLGITREDIIKSVWGKNILSVDKLEEVYEIMSERRFEYLVSKRDETNSFLSMLKSVFAPCKVMKRK